MAVTAETKSRPVRVEMACETLESGIVVPGTVTQIGYIGRMDSRIGSENAVAIPVAAWLGTERLRNIVTGGAPADILAGRIGMGRGINPRTEIKESMVERYGSFLSVAWLAECFKIVTASALEFLALGIESMIEFVIEIVRETGQVVISVAITAECFGLMAGETSRASLDIGVELVRMLVIPGMYQCPHLFGPRMAGAAFRRGLVIVVATEAIVHRREVRGR